MKDLAKMRLGVLRELKNIRKFFDYMEIGVKKRNPDSIQKAYVFIKAFAYHMEHGDLAPLDVLLHLELLKNELDKDEE